MMTASPPTNRRISARLMRSPMRTHSNTHTHGYLKSIHVCACVWRKFARWQILGGTIFGLCVLGAALARVCVCVCAVFTTPKTTYAPPRQAAACVCVCWLILFAWSVCVSVCFASQCNDVCLAYACAPATCAIYVSGTCKCAHTHTHTAGCNKICFGRCHPEIWPRSVWPATNQHHPPPSHVPRTTPVHE